MFYLTRTGMSVGFLRLLKGKLDEFVNKNLSEKATKQLKDVLSIKEACEKLLNSPQAKELMKKLKEGK